MSYSRRKAVYVTFEDTTGPSWVKKSTDALVVCGLKTLEERTTSSSHGSKAGLRSMSLILKDIQQSLSLSDRLETFGLMLSEPQNSIVVIDCITPVFLEPAIDPIHFLGSLLSLQRIPPSKSTSNLFSVHCDSFSPYGYIPTPQVPILPLSAAFALSYLNDSATNIFIRSSRSQT